MLGKLAPAGGGPPIPLLKSKLVVGRHRSCDIALPLPTISARHCELELTDGYWFVRDLGSSNGTRVNGNVCESEWLWPDDVLGLASHRYAVFYEPPEGRRPPQRVGSPGVKLPPFHDSSGADRSAPATAPPSQEGVTGIPCLGKLIPCAGGPPIPLRKSRVVVGRHDSCDVVLASGAVSGRHCQLEWTDGGWLVRDLQSRNGTLVDGVRCDVGRLAPGSILWLGGLRYEIAYVPQGTEAPVKQKGPTFVQSLLEKAGLMRLGRESFGGGRLPPEVADDSSRQRYSLDDPEE